MAAYCQVYGVIHFTSPAGRLPVHRDQLRAQRSITSMGKLYLFYLLWVHRHTVTLSLAFHINWRHNVLQLIVTLSLETCLPCICIPVPFADSSVSLNCHCKRFCRQHSPLKSALNGHRALCYWRTCIVYRRLFAGPDVGARIQLQCLLFPVIDVI